MNEKLESLKKAWKEVDKVELAKEVVKGAVIGAAIGVAGAMMAIGAAFVVGQIEGQIEMKRDPEKFKAEQIAFFENIIAEIKKESDKEENGGE